MFPGRAPTEPMARTLQGTGGHVPSAPGANAGQSSLGTTIRNVGIRTTTGRPSPVVPR